MNVGMRHRPAPNAGRFAFLLVSVIALALACFPVFAHAEDSSGAQYSDAIPKAEGENTPTHHKQPTQAKSSSTDNGGGTAPSGSNPEGSKEAEGSGEGESSSKGSGVAATKHDGGGTGQSSPGGSANRGAKNAVHPGSQKASPATQSHSDSGGSSPLVPILIAIAALAAISVAAVMIRQRRQRGGPAATASPEAN
jgi:cobalamin biosynthesis Mg chelatase CobN